MKNCICFENMLEIVTTGRCFSMLAISISKTSCSLVTRYSESFPSACVRDFIKSNLAGELKRRFKNVVVIEWSKDIPL